nr:pyruvate kinase [Nevskia soli]
MTHGNAPGKPAEIAAELKSLANELAVLRNEMLAVQPGATDQLHPAYRDSAGNLLHYLVLRRHDIRTLQERLAELGLSSLGRAESHVLSTLNAVLKILGDPGGAAAPSHRAGVDRASGLRLLREHTEALMGPAPEQRAVRIMVTMPSEAAQDYGLVLELMRQGMDCMRINCAHDDAAAWTRMVEHLRLAEKALQRRCRLLMDLAGPKLRTGPLEPGPAVMKVRPQRDELGRVLLPARVWLTPQEHPCPAPGAADASLPVPGAWLSGLKAGSRVYFTDVRSARRTLEVAEAGSEGCWAELRKTAYFVPGLALNGEGHEAQVGALPAREGVLLLQQGDVLILTRDGLPGRMATTDEQGALLAPARIGCLPPEAFEAVRVGERVSFDDGRIWAIVERIDADGIGLRITRTRPGGGKLRGGKGINLPDSQGLPAALTPKDVQDLRFVARNADMVALSFANSADDVRQLLGEIVRLGAERPAIVLKIETRRGFDCLPEMLLEAMKWPRCGVMIARGDLAVECGFERLAEVQEEILWICESAHVPVIWATQVLETLAREGQPSRAEITDAAMGDRAECVMLNKGPHILQAVRTLDDILRRMQAHQSKKSPQLRALRLARLFAGTTAGGPAVPFTKDGSAPEPASHQEVRFGQSQELDLERRMVVFTAFRNGEMIPCFVHVDDLARALGIDPARPLPDFARHRGPVERAAQLLLRDGRREPDHSVRVRAEDLVAALGGRASVPTGIAEVLH